MKVLAIILSVCTIASANGCDKPNSASGGGASSSSTKQIAGEKIDASLSAIQQYLQSGELAKAEAIARTLIDRAPAEARAHEMFGQVLLAKAGASEQQGDAAAATDLKSQAWSSYKKATELDSSNPGLMHSAALVAMTAGAQNEALELFLKAESLDASNPQYPLFAAQVLLQQKRLDEAEAALKRALSVAPDEPYVHASLAMVALERGRFDDAHKAIAIARSAEPDNVGFRAQQAKIYRRQERAREALELLIGLDETSRAQEAVTFEIAAAYESLGEPLKAAQAWAACATANHRAPTAYLAATRAGELFLKGGDRPNAAQWTSVAERLRPDASEVKALRAKLTATNGG